MPQKRIFLSGRERKNEMKKTTKAATKEVATVKANNLPAKNDLMDQIIARSGEGFENVTADDIRIPRITILQALSPQLSKKKAEYIEGAQSGQICDVSCGETWDELHVIPVAYEVRYLEWAPRSTGKGLVAVHASKEDWQHRATKNDDGQFETEEGNIIVESAQWYCINISDGQQSNCFIAMSSTQRKRSKDWMTLATKEKVTLRDGSMRTPPLFYRSYKLSVVEESNNEGSWFGWKIERDVPITELPNAAELFAAATSFRESVIGGFVRATDDQVAGEAGGNSSSKGAM